MDDKTIINQVNERLDKVEMWARLAAKSVLNLKDVVLLTGFSTQYLYTLTSTHQIPHYKNGNKLFFKKAEIEEWLTSFKVKTDAEIESEAATRLATQRMQQRFNK